jgi:hypothetical protein
MKRVALFFDRTYIDAHSCFTELAKHLAESGYEVDLYCFFNSFNPPPAFYNQHIRVLNFPRSKFERADFWYRITFVKEYEYKAVIGTPFEGAFLAQKVSRRLNIPFIYFADEVFNMASDRHDFSNYSKLKEHDIRVNNSAIATIALGRERYDYQTKINKLNANHKYFIIPNAPSGKSEQLRSHYFRDVFNINDNKPIVLFIGSLSWMLAEKLYESSRKYSEKPYHLIFHTRTIGLLGSTPHPFIKISQTPIPSVMLNYLISSADIGLVLYDKESIIEKENALTAGKIGTYLKNNLPLIVGNVENLKQLDANGIAVYIEDIHSIDQAVQRIMTNLATYKKNIENVYSKAYNYSLFYKPFESFLNEAIK